MCVIIAAKNAADTIGRAIGSALREPEVSEVLVVDDGSTDATAETARVADDGSGRLVVLSLETNEGPAHARNRAIAGSSAPLIAILDADDFFLRGRFSRLLKGDDWDFVADNIVFVEAHRIEQAEPDVRQFESDPQFLDLRGFIDGNISARGRKRGEIGFLKPVMRRAFLDRHALRYHEDLRLGEDYELYCRALAKGARYKIIHSCGYGAVVRPDSLSGRHRTDDLRRLYEADREILALPGLPQAALTSLRRHERHVRARYELRNFLDTKADAGLAAAAFRALRRPSALPAIIGGIAADKMEAFRDGTSTPAAAPMAGEGLRYLLPGTTIAQK